MGLTHLSLINLRGPMRLPDTARANPLSYAA
jgi:hypothetical protein